VLSCDHSSPLCLFLVLITLACYYSQCEKKFHFFFRLKNLMSFYNIFNDIGRHHIPDRVKKNFCLFLIFIIFLSFANHSCMDDQNCNTYFFRHHYLILSNYVNFYTFILLFHLHNRFKQVYCVYLQSERYKHSSSASKL
jgi:hypothetical protein